MMGDLGALRRSTAALWICPFRLFFLLTALSAALAVGWWLGILAGALPMPPAAGGPLVWHAHELLFGFAMASIAGFLLTAVPEFTGGTGIDGRRLRLLVALWLGGRIAYALSGVLGVIPAAACDLALLLGLLASSAGPIWRQPGRRHLAFVYSLVALTVVHAGFYLALATDADALAWLRLATGVIMVLIVVALSRISMRLVNDVLAAQGGVAAPYLARPPRRNLATFTIAACSLAQFLLPGNAVGGWLALAAAAALFNLLNDWHVGRALGQRWVLIPYLVYWCMALGYGLIGAALLGAGLPVSAGEHLLLVGALGLSVLIVMAVAGRMHSGWGLDQRPWLPLVALLLLAAGILRGGAGWLFPVIDAREALLAAGALWVAGWFVYLARSWRVLAGPRPDGGTGCEEAAPVR
jgi:uncharacterized protein involved in response to NO